MSEPTQCPKCQSKELVTEIKAIDGGVASEYQVACRSCGADVGYYTYGSWDPNFVRGQD